LKQLVGMNRDALHDQVMSPTPLPKSPPVSSIFTADSVSLHVFARKR
jgi:hypothetical protein